MLVKILIGVLIVVLVVVSGGLYLAYRHLHSPEFEAHLVRSAREVVGSEVHLGDLEISLLQGVVMRDLAIENPLGLEGDLLTIEEVVLRYRLLALLRGKVELERFLLRRPVMNLIPAADGQWNFEALEGFQTGKGSPPEGEPEAPARSLDFSLSNLVVEEGEVVMRNGAGEEVTRVEDLNLTGRLAGREGVLSGSGMLEMEVLRLGDAVALTRVRAPVSFSNEEVKLAPLSAVLADGEVSGEITLKLVPRFKYLMDLEIQGADVSGLLQEAGVAAGLSGELKSSLDVEGRAGLPTVVGEGTVQVLGGRLSGFSAQNLLADLLNTPSLREIEFTECVVEFTLADNLMETRSIRLISPLLELTGNGEVTLPDTILNHQVTLALHQDLLETLPPPVSQAFEQREDGFRTLPFRIWGPVGSPRTDLQDRLVQKALKPVIDEGINRLKEIFR